MTIGDTPDFKEVEWVNAYRPGVQVKLVGQDTPVDDYQLKPAFMQNKMDVPLEIRQALDVLRSDVNALHAEAKALGILGMGTDHDAHADYFPREMSNEEKLIEAPPWSPHWPRPTTIRRADCNPHCPRWEGHESTRVSNPGTSGVLFLRGQPPSVTSSTRLTNMRRVSDPINGVNPKIIDGTSARHLEPLAEKMGITADELWDEMGLGFSSGTQIRSITPLADGSRIMENGQQISQIELRQLGLGRAHTIPAVQHSERRCWLSERCLTTRRA